MLAEVSTHSRPKAAGERYRKSPVDTDCFNTQPPEGGWAFKLFCSQQGCCFNTQPPEGGWTIKINDDNTLTIVSTHSRPKAAGKVIQEEAGWRVVSTHSRPKAAGTFILTGRFNIGRVSTHSRPKAAGRLSGGDVVLSECFNTQPPEGGWTLDQIETEFISSFNTQPPEGGWKITHTHPKRCFVFQHTAARRRLGHARQCLVSRIVVSTHSRPKAAGLLRAGKKSWLAKFQHTAARRRLDCATGV